MASVVVPPRHFMLRVVQHERQRRRNRVNAFLASLCAGPGHPSRQTKELTYIPSVPCMTIDEAFYMAKAAQVRDKELSKEYLAQAAQVRQLYVEMRKESLGGQTRPKAEQQPPKQKSGKIGGFCVSKALSSSHKKFLMASVVVAPRHFMLRVVQHERQRRRNRVNAFLASLCAGPGHPSRQTKELTYIPSVPCMTIDEAFYMAKAAQVRDKELSKEYLAQAAQVRQLYVEMRKESLGGQTRPKAEQQPPKQPPANTNKNRFAKPFPRHQRGGLTRKRALQEPQSNSSTVYVRS